MVIYMNIKDWHVNMREGFSDRNNLISLKKTLQYDDLDYRTRVEILNKTDEIFVEYFKQENVNWGIIRNRKTHPDFGCDLLKDVFCIPYVEAEEISQDGSWEEVVNNVILNHPYFLYFILICNIPYFPFNKTISNVFLFEYFIISFLRRRQIVIW